MPTVSANKQAAGIIESHITNIFRRHHASLSKFARTSNTYFFEFENSSHVSIILYKTNLKKVYQHNHIQYIILLCCLAGKRPSLNDVEDAQAFVKHTL